ncbi:hypothetical protein Thimo_3488 [Thioflavicoccus mobilis 8321]|uniref:Methyltransferase domain-containing protein n=1 Tax=Thioflavicoccus mobilis 8321 TaxID=765912 RepID=L0H1P2_9GAMM|nr:class I SAM-dependent methyltransferase [Thioflavicoccus mobilis]AGA92151.1 hypothetical protein Thimo_3488 [Thioflavicoccus mobilis 8321]
MAPPATDWDCYYAKPAATAHLTRRLTERRLLALLRTALGQREALSVCELGGANSCFAAAFLEALPIRSYRIIDTNARGLALLATRFGDDARVTWEHGDVLTPDPAHAGRYDLVYSVGLIEHFDPVGTRRGIATHLDYCRPGGLVLMTFPTPTRLYRGLRALLEAASLWDFPDERPLGFDEVLGSLAGRGELLHRSINWPILLTQGLVAVRAGGAHRD